MKDCSGWCGWTVSYLSLSLLIRPLLFSPLSLLSPFPSLPLLCIALYIISANMLNSTHTHKQGQVLSVKISQLQTSKLVWKFRVLRRGWLRPTSGMCVCIGLMIFTDDVMHIVCYFWNVLTVLHYVIPLHHLFSQPSNCHIDGSMLALSS